MVDFKLYLENNFVSSPEKIMIGIDDLTLVETVMPVKEINFNCELDDSYHTLWIKLVDKKPENELRQNGCLVSDTYINVFNLSINGSMMNHLLNDNGYVIPDWEYHKDVAEWFKINRGEIPTRLEKSKYLNLKGVYYFNFYLPIKDYLLEKIPLHPTYSILYNEALDKFEKLEAKLLSN